ncbi:MAG: cardiolipin synthase B [Aquabacterium sp.]|jgi:cardiolipin synthase|nr:MAG: cardiolipin synthase B [Aquabacterium sp.]
MPAQEGPPREDAAGRWWTRAAACLGMLLAGCGSLPPRADQAPEFATPSRAALASKLVVEAPGGRLHSAQRRQLLARLDADSPSSDALKRQLAGMTQVAAGQDERVVLHADNAARLLVDGPRTFQAMFAALEAARDTVLLESYIIDDAELAKQFADVLIRKTQAGVRTYVLYDAVGSIGTSKAYFDALRSQGVQVCEYNPLNPLKRPGYWNIVQRDHRKILVVDERLAYTGGINISHVYAEGSAPLAPSRTKEDPGERGWRDTQVELRGPAASALAGLVRQTWQDQGCQGVMPPAAPVARAAGDKVVQVIPTSPDGQPSRIYLSLLTAIDASRSSVHLSMAYFAPGRDMLDALCDASGRGVDVALLLPSVSDFTPVLNAGRSYYAGLLECGVRIYELQGALLHAKTAVIDKVWSTVGSSNMDWLSFARNNEVNVVVLGEDFAGDMDAQFQRDLAASQQVTAQQWAKRPVGDRIKQWFSRLAERLF